MLDISTGAPEPSVRPAETVESDSVFAALDLGTNNCRLLIASPQLENDDSVGARAGSFRVFDSFSRIVRLG